jgi:hypothetical protein
MEEEEETEEEEEETEEGEEEEDDDDVSTVNIPFSSRKAYGSVEVTPVILNLAKRQFYIQAAFSR